MPSLAVLVSNAQGAHLELLRRRPRMRAPIARWRSETIVSSSPAPGHGSPPPGRLQCPWRKSFPDRCLRHQLPRQRPIHPRRLAFWSDVATMEINGKRPVLSTVEAGFSSAFADNWLRAVGSACPGPRATIRFPGAPCRGLHARFLVDYLCRHPFLLAGAVDDRPP